MPDNLISIDSLGEEISLICKGSNSNGAVFFFKGCILLAFWQSDCLNIAVKYDEDPSWVLNEVTKEKSVVAVLKSVMHFPWLNLLQSHQCYITFDDGGDIIGWADNVL